MDSLLAGGPSSADVMTGSISNKEMGQLPQIGSSLGLWFFFFFLFSISLVGLNF
jgi:hypothetical protein